MLTVAELAVEVSANTRPAEEGLLRTNKEVEKSGGLFSNLKGFAGNALSTLMGFVGGQIVFAGLSMAIGQVTDMVSEMFSEAGNLSDAEALLNQRLLSTHDAVGMSSQAIEDLAQRMSDLSGIAESTILQGDDMLLTFTNIGKDVFPQASQAMEDLAVSMNHGKTAGADFQTAAIELGKALNDPLKGMTALQRVGVTFSEQQKELIKHYMDMGDTADAQKVILQELSKEFGGTAQAAGSTFGGSLNKLKNIIVDFGANALQKVETWLQPWIDGFAKWLPGALKTAGDWLGNAGKQIGDFFSHLSGAGTGFDFGGMVTALQGLGQTILQQVLPIALQLSSWFQKDMLPAIQSVLPSIQSFAQFIVNTVVPAFIQVEGYAAQVGATIAKTLLPIFEKIYPIVVKLAGWLLDMGHKALAFLIPKVQDAFKAISQFATEMSTRLQPFIQRLIQGIQVGADIIGKVWNYLWPWMSAVLKTAWDDISGIINIAWQFISGLFKIFADILSGNWGQMWTDIQSLAQNVWGAVKKWIGSIWDDLKGLWDKGTGYIKDAWGKVWNGLADIAKGAWDGVKGVIRNGINGVIDLLNHLVDAANHIPGVHIPPIGHVNFAQGGIMPYSGMAWVGEHGPEPVFLPQGSRVVSHGDAVSALRGGRGGDMAAMQQSLQNIENLLGRIMAQPQVILNGPTSDQLMRELELHRARQKALYSTSR